MKIYAPVQDANGYWCNVKFVNGVADCDEPHLIEWFESHGYRIEKREPKVIKAPKVKLPNLEAMTPNEIKEWAKEHGVISAIGQAKSKAKIIENLRRCCNE